MTLESEANIPKSQDTSANRGNDPHDSGGDPPTPPEHNNSDDDSAPLSKRLEVWKFMGEVIIIIITFYIACIYYGQLNQMIESNRISRESLQSVQRAFITVNPVPEMQTEKTGNSQIMFFNFWMENSGVTPTKKLSAHVNWAKSNKGLPLPPDFTFPDQNIDESQDSTVSVVGPKGRFPLIVGPIPKEFMEKLYNREVRLFVYGWVRYNDVFENTPLHIVKFSYELVGIPGTVRLQNGQEGQGIQTRVNGLRFNCYDEECNEQTHQ